MGPFYVPLTLITRNSSLKPHPLYIRRTHNKMTSLLWVFLMCINIKLVTSYKSIYVGVYSFQFSPVICMFSYSPQEAYRGKMTYSIFMELGSTNYQRFHCIIPMYIIIGSIKSRCACTFTVPCRLQVIQC